MPAQRKYNWEKWFGRTGVTELVRGKDYFCTQSAMIQQIRNAAHRRRVKVRPIDCNDSIKIEVENAICSTD